MDTSELENTIFEINQMSVEQLNNLERKIDEILKKINEINDGDIKG